MSKEVIVTVVNARSDRLICLDENLSRGATRTVMAGMCDVSYSTGEFFMSREKFSLLYDISDRSIKRAIHELIEKGYISIIEKGIPNKQYSSYRIKNVGELFFDYTKYDRTGEYAIDPFLKKELFDKYNEMDVLEFIFKKSRKFSYHMLTKNSSVEEIIRLHKEYYDLRRRYSSEYMARSEMYSRRKQYSDALEERLYHCDCVARGIKFSEYPLSGSEISDDPNIDIRPMVDKIMGRIDINFRKILDKISVEVRKAIEENRHSPSIYIIIDALYADDPNSHLRRVK